MSGVGGGAETGAGLPRLRRQQQQPFHRDHVQFAAKSPEKTQSETVKRAGNAAARTRHQ